MNAAMTGVPVMDAPFLYIVRFWVSPEGLETVVRWLDRGHMKEVIAQPGFFWVRRVRLEQDAADGWHGYMMIYGLESREALQRYFDSPALARFAEERGSFERHLRMERCWGEVEARLP